MSEPSSFHQSDVVRNKAGAKRQITGRTVRSLRLTIEFLQNTF